MSLDPVTLLTIATVVSAGSQVFGGFSEKKAAEEQADLLREQARIQEEETAAEAQRKSQERDKFIAKQKVAFLANGVGLAGTGVVVLQDTFNEFGKEIDAIKRSGASKARLLNKEADIKEKSGRASLISGVLGGGSTIAGNIYSGKTQGIF